MFKKQPDRWSDRTVAIEGDLASYVDEIWVQEPDSAAGLLDATAWLRARGMLSSPTQNRMLHWLVGTLGEILRSDPAIRNISLGAA